ncbi:MAG TPA: hypothetical protein VIF37_19840 [Methylobacter sp.]|jgi:hypothetical protein
MLGYAESQVHGNSNESYWINRQQPSSNNISNVVARNVSKEKFGRSGKRYNLKTIAASLKRQSLVAKATRKFKATTNSRHNLPMFDNLPEQNFTATARSSPEMGWRYILLRDERRLVVPAVLLGLFLRHLLE